MKSPKHPESVNYDNLEAVALMRTFTPPLIFVTANGMKKVDTFNHDPETWIPYQIAKPTNVSISIYSADGKLVRSLALGHQPIGIYQSKSRAAYWDGRNALGEPVASGVYFYTLTVREFTATQKMLIMK